MSQVTNKKILNKVFCLSLLRIPKSIFSCFEEFVFQFLLFFYTSFSKKNILKMKCISKNSSACRQLLHKNGRKTIFLLRRKQVFSMKNTCENFLCFWIHCKKSRWRKILLLFFYHRFQMIYWKINKTSKIFQNWQFSNILIKYICFSFSRRPASPAGLLRRQAGRRKENSKIFYFFSDRFL